MKNNIQRYLRISSGAVLSLFLSTALHANIVAYPKKGQSEEQQETDKAKCAQWAKKETGVDPEALLNQSSQGSGSNAVRGAGRGAAAGAVGGAIAGNAGKGAAIGAGVGALGGAARRARHEGATNAQVQQQMETYEQAQKTCLEGKGYSVS